MANVDGADPDSRNWDIDGPELRSERPLVRDRSVPTWAVVLGSLFSLAIATCIIIMILLSIFLERIVISSGETRMSFVLLAMAGTLALAIVILEISQAKALSGFRGLREFQSKKVNAILSAFLALIVLFIHPLAGVIIPTVAAIGALGLRYLANAKTTEPDWVFEPNEAMSLFAGRDARGLTQAISSPGKHPLGPAVRKACFWLAIGSGVALGSYLVSMRLLMPGIVVALTLLSAWSVDSILRFVEALLFERPQDRDTISHPRSIANDKDPSGGLTVQSLSVQTSTQKNLLSSISLEVEPGQIIGVSGESGSGKTLLLSAISDPNSIKGAQTTGQITCAGMNLWARSNEARRPLVAYVQDNPIIVPASGADNLCCYQGLEQLERGKFFLEQMVFAKELTNEICDAEDASTLPSMQKKALAIARAFAISPHVYLFDRPEDGLKAAQISAFCNRLEQEARLGRCILIVSDNRMILEKCDQLLVMQAGTITDFGVASDVRSRLETGWHRFVAKRQLETETSLHEWVRSHFRRNGDEANRQKVSRTATELLAFSCREAQSHDEDIEFLFKNFQGHCILKMHDPSPSTSSVQIQTAQEMADDPTLNTGRNPLTNVMCEVEDIEFASRANGRELSCKIKTYDPRKSIVKKSA